MTRRLIIHLGPRKTATSAIQRFLSKHDNSVVIYPKTGLGGLADYHGHHGLVFKFTGEERAEHAVPGSLDEMLAAILAEAQDSDLDIVFSAEVLKPEGAGAFVTMLLERLAPAGPMEPLIVIAIREHFARAASWYNHRLRVPNSGEKRLPDKFLVKTGIEVCYEPMVKQLEKTGFALSALNYHPSETWVPRFLMTLGFAEGSIGPIEKELAGTDPKLMIVALALKRVLRSRDGHLRILRRFRAMPESDTAGSIFGRDAALAAERFFSADRDFLNQRFGIELTPPDMPKEGDALHITEAELVHIEAVAADLGEKGRQIVEFARDYVR